MLAGVMYGCMYYKKKLTLPRVLATKFIVMLVCNVFLEYIVPHRVIWTGIHGDPSGACIKESDYVAD